MPRRKTPVLRRAEADQSEAEACRLTIREIIQDTDPFARLPDAQQRPLEDRLVDAVGFAKAGLATILAGKRTRPAAWTMDIFVKDVCDAMKDVRLRALMDPDPETSSAQLLAKKLAKAVRLPDQGNLYKQMQRARDIEKTRLPDLTITLMLPHHRQ